MNANFLQKLSRLVLVTFLAPLLFSRISAQSARPFLHPDRIRYDSQCLTIDGKDVFIYSGAFHYFRCPKELWHDRFQKIKDAGFNTVETYVPWNWCEQQMPTGVNDFSRIDLKDFDDWLTMAEQFGFYIIVRPGPYICAEWDTGGYPQWLLTKKTENPLRSQEWLRSDDPVYLAWCRHWYDAVCPIIARHQITRKAPGQPGVILVQLENEYDFPDFPDEVKINQVKALAQDARADGIDVPFISCWTHVVRGSTDPILRQIFDCCNFYPRWAIDNTSNDVEKLRREQPDAPLGTTELQGGWFSNVGGQLSQDQDGLTAAQINNLTLFMIQNGESLLSYYMLFGGTNPDDWGARGITTTYDYAAPIREWGGAGERYQRVWAIGHMLQEHGVKLARSSAVNCDVTTQNDVTVVERRAPDGSRYFFVRNSQNRERRQGSATVRENGNSAEITFNYD
ncbi:MAG TPA: beta-galactosidase, partial [Candidatus Acidoferrum sp.]|nr:beta-galactosidase [Candidatus Acidoferrum sp.]